MNNINNNEQLLIEEIRRRAKDNKSELANLFYQASEQHIDKTRNYLFLLNLGIIGYLGSVNKGLSKSEITILTLPLIIGFSSIIFSYKYALNNANYYAELEKNLSTSFLTREQYNSALEKEDKIRKKYSNRHTAQFLSIFSIVIQFVLTVIAIFIALT